jgi:hypothetical protein
MRPVLAPRFALLVAVLIVGPALVGGGCMVVLDLPEYTLCGPAGAGGCGGASDDGGLEAGEDAHAHP